MQHQEHIARRFEPLVGGTISAVRPLTEQEAREHGWRVGAFEAAVVLVLDDGTLVIPARDHAGTGPGGVVVVPMDPDDVEPTCDVCGVGQYHSEERDWDGETGCHVVCQLPTDPP